MQSKKYYVRTFGCQMNVYDSDLIAGHLQLMGYFSTEELKEADIVLVNTCTVRQHAENRALSESGRLKFWKRRKPGRMLIFAGCVASRLKSELKHRFPQVDLVVPADEIEQFPSMFSILQSSNHQITKSLNHLITQSLNHSITSFVAISRGCSNYCSYCVVPYVRGEEKCRPVEDIISEIQSIVKNGVKEVTLLGQNVNSYMMSPVSSVQCSKPEDKRQSSEKDFLRTMNDELQTNFADLLRRVNEIENLQRIRFMTSHPKDLSDETIIAIRDLDKVCEHVHLPVQSGSDRILKLMNRKYTREYYLKLVKKIRDTVPGVAISTDFVVGFPTETESDFKQTLSLVNEVGFDFAYVFKYSPREGTASAKMADDVTQEDKQQRLSELLELVNLWARKQNKLLLDTEQQVLVETYEDGKLVGKTRSNRAIVFEGNKELVGKTVKVKIMSCKIHSLEGELG